MTTASVKVLKRALDADAPLPQAPSLQKNSPNHKTKEPQNTAARLISFHESSAHAERHDRQAEIANAMSAKTLEL